MRNLPFCTIHPDVQALLFPFLFLAERIAVAVDKRLSLSLDLSALDGRR
jgi:hypothetical protein